MYLIEMRPEEKLFRGALFCEIPLHTEGAT